MQIQEREKGRERRERERKKERKKEREKVVFRGFFKLASASQGGGGRGSCQKPTPSDNLTHGGPGGGRGLSQKLTESQKLILNVLINACMLT